MITTYWMCTECSAPCVVMICGADRNDVPDVCVMGEDCFDDWFQIDRKKFEEVTKEE